MKNIFTLMLAALGLTACTSQKQAEPTESSKVLVLYYSQTGFTQRVAAEIQFQLNADIESIELEEPYSGDYGQTIERCKKEMDESLVPTVKPLASNLDAYDTIFIGYPIWFGTYAQPIAGLVKSQPFKNKTLVTFCTFGSGGLQSSTENLAKALPEANVIEGYGVREARIDVVAEEVNRFLIERGYKEGTVEALPAFMEHKPVTEAEIEVFNKACGDYPFPLGTPVDVAVRETANSTDYEFTSEQNSPNGEDVKLLYTVYVTVGKDGSAPVFTQVIR